MQTSSCLPHNWVLVLEQIQHALTQAIQLAEAREAALFQPVFPPAVMPADDPLTGRLVELEQCATRIEAPLAELDRDLKEEESHVRAHLVKVADLRRLLADWAGRALR